MRVLAALDDSADAGPVAEFAAALAKVLDTPVDGLHVRIDGVDRALCGCSAGRDPAARGSRRARAPAFDAKRSSTTSRPS